MELLTGPLKDRSRCNSPR